PIRHRARGSRSRSWTASSPPRSPARPSATATTGRRIERVQQAESFEEVYKQLEEAVRQLEEGGLTLDASISLYERGMNLAKQCQALLDQAELRVTQLQDLLATRQPDHEDQSFEDED